MKLDFTWRFGVPLKDQLNTDMVEFSRTLAGSRYDLADRNYDIVMQYRKQDLVSLALSVDSIPYAGTAVIVTGKVSSKYDLKNITWDAPELLTAGGTVTPLTSTTARITLPPKSAKETSTGYVIGAVATDIRGNTSNHATLTLIPVSAEDIGIIPKPEPSTAEADGKATVTVTIPVVDKSSGSSMPLAGQNVTITLKYTSGSEKGKLLSGFPVTLKSDSDGKIILPISSNQVGNVSLTATLDSNGNSITTAPDFISFIAAGSTGGFDPTNNPGSNLTTLLDNQLADGSSANTIKAVVTDKDGNPVSGQTVSFTVSAGASITTTQGITDTQGVATASVTSTTAGTYTVTAAVNGSSKTVLTRFIADINTAHFTPPPVVTGDNAVANGKDTIGVDFVVKDAYGNPVADQDVIITTSNGAMPAKITVKTDSNGMAHVDISKTSPGTADVTAELKGAMTQTSVNFIDPIATITVTGDVNTYPAVGVALKAAYTCVSNCASTISWAWQIETAAGSGVFADIPGATTDTYTPVRSDQKRKIRVNATVLP